MPHVEVDGINLYYEERGQGDPLVLIMGLGADHTLWDPHVAAYEQHFRCILIDNRGAGRSDKPEGPYTTRMMADDVAALMDALGIEQARVAGISMGGAIAQELALCYPQKVKSLILICTWPRCDPYTVNVFEHFRDIRAHIDPLTFVKVVHLWIFAPPYFESHMDDLIQGQQESAANFMPQHAYAAQCEACITHDTLDRLEQIEVPTLITVGDMDIFTPIRFSEQMLHRIPDSEMLIYEGCGHVHHFEVSEKFNEDTLEFLKSH
ncbi:MAG: alpha/beta fold hydrolase [Armatimonadetes bacterium]|nr:alpha/beta fold hydrolase [Armatimonadota bacterium]